MDGFNLPVTTSYLWYKLYTMTWWTTYAITKELSKIIRAPVYQLLRCLIQLFSHSLKIVFKTFVMLTVILKIVTKCHFQNNFHKSHYFQFILTEKKFFSSNFNIWGIEHKAAISHPWPGVLLCNGLTLFCRHVWSVVTTLICSHICFLVGEVGDDTWPRLPFRAVLPSTGEMLH